MASGLSEGNEMVKEYSNAMSCKHAEGWKQDRNKGIIKSKDGSKCPGGLSTIFVFDDVTCNKCEHYEEVKE